MNACAKIQVIGEVQGVGFRYFAKREATRLGLSGYVRNLRDGSVESEVEGGKNEVEAYLQSLSKGPAFSDVRNVEVAWQPFQGKYHDFCVTY
jgi:acylphosphatase